MRSALVLLVLVVAATRVHADRLVFDPAAIYKVPRGASPADGPAAAPITIVGWSDYACGHCYRVQATLAALDRLYPGQIRWVHRTLPLDDDNTTTAEAALAAAAQGRFLPMNDRLYAVAGRVDRAAVELIARELGLDMVRFRADLDTRTYRAQIAADTADARGLGVTGTPTFFVNGRPVHGNQPLRVFAEVVDEELARAHAAPSRDYDALVASGRVVADALPAPSAPSFELDVNETYRVGLGLPGHQLGPDSAPVTLIAWSDFQCQFCAKTAPVLAHVRQKYGDDVRIVFRHLAMSFHRNAGLAAEAGVAAAEQGKFWAFHDQVFSHFGALTRADLDGFAKAAGLDLERFTRDLDERRYHDAVIVEGADALALGVDGTPTMFINGKVVIGARDAAALDAIIDLQLDRARGAVKAGLAAVDIYAVVMSDAKGVERADPSRVPDATAARVALRADDRSRAVTAACRRRDAARAMQLAAGFTGEARQRAAAVCAAVGIDL